MKLLKNLAYPKVVWLLVAVLAILTGVATNNRSDEELAHLQTPLMMRLLGKAYAHQSDTLDAASKLALWHSLEGYNRGSVHQRQCFIVLTAELAPQKTEALCKGLSIAIEQGVFRTVEINGKNHEKEAQYILNMLYIDKIDAAVFYDSKRQKEGEMLTDSLGWFGRLALAPQTSSEVENALSKARVAVLGEAKIAAFLVFDLYKILLALAAVGCYLLFKTIKNFVYLPPLVGNARIYGETFLMGLGLLFGLQWLGAKISIALFPSCGLLVACFAFFGSLVVLAWPSIRGISTEVVKKDIGLEWGPNPLSTLKEGVFGYTSHLVFIGIGIIPTLILAFLFGGQVGSLGAAHPLTTAVLEGNTWIIIQAFILAAIAAPIVEEILFRGFLDASLRSIYQSSGLSAQAVTRWSIFFGFLVAGMVQTFIFAAIHPQGWVMVPMLMAMAWNLTILRHKNRSLIPAMITHSISNGVTLTILLLISIQ